jgi:hypothetical protein
MAGKGEIMSGGRIGEGKPGDRNVIGGGKGLGGWWIV